MKYTFIGEFGRRELTHAQYLKDRELPSRMADSLANCILPLGKTILVYDRDWLEAHEEEHNRFLVMEKCAHENPLQFFLPTSNAVNFLNDGTHSVKMLLCPNRVGKTASMAVDIILDAIPTSEEWPIFSRHGVKYRPWKGPIHCGFASSDWNVVERVLWPEVRKWLPRYELEHYGVETKEISARSSPEISLGCGSKFFFFCYEQKQGPFESQALHRWGWDEQGEEAKFDGADERLRTLRGRHVFALTPHAVEGRPDTGARSWINQMVSGSKTKGHSISQYHIAISDVPDWVYPDTEKKKAYQKWVVEPAREKNHKALKEGRARYYGEWHDAAGLVFDEWDDSIHLVDPFDIPDSWTRYRAIDHGTKNPSACLWGAVSPEGDLYVYREYYRAGSVISENCRNIISLSNNERESRGTVRNNRAGMILEKYVEVTTRERYHRTVMDSRSFSGHDDYVPMEIGELYKAGGLRVTKASGQPGEKSIPIVKEFLRVDMDRKHPRTGKPGASKLYVFNTLSNFIRERRGYANVMYKSTKVADSRNVSEKPRAKDDHLMDCLAYLCQIPPRYIPDRWAFYEGRNAWDEEQEDLEDKRKKSVLIDPYTGRRFF